MELLISATGQVRTLYTEALDLTRLGQLAIRRASHVEPDSTGAWWANLEPVGGPMLGPHPQRSRALEAEQDWLQANWLVPRRQPT
jgi:hypothetical protein